MGEDGLLDDVSTIDVFGDLGVHLVPRAADVRVEEPAERAEVFVEGLGRVAVPPLDALARRWRLAGVEALLNSLEVPLPRTARAAPPPEPRPFDQDLSHVRPHDTSRWVMDGHAARSGVRAPGRSVVAGGDDARRFDHQDHGPLRRPRAVDHALRHHETLPRLQLDGAALQVDQESPADD